MADLSIRVDGHHPTLMKKGQYICKDLWFVTGREECAGCVICIWTVDGCGTEMTWAMSTKLFIVLHNGV